MAYQNTLPRRLNQWRKTRCYTAQEMADLLCIGLRSYRNYESGDRSPSLDILVQIADILEVSTDYLLGRTENPLMNTSDVL
jgi:transcriptional regulator with XRE-family HTH domain|nr:MAG TPA: repressor protein [Caudoviricetes sp.]